jgi:hypothetical protein
VRLVLDDPSQVERAALILGPAAPGRTDGAFRLDVDREAGGVAPGSALVGRVLERLDREGIGGRVELAAAAEAESRPVEERSLAVRWQELVDELPDDWSHVLAEVELHSSDFVDRGALLMAPCNPMLTDGLRTLRFRGARLVGYGVSAGMARRCLERLDRERITGRVRILRVVSESRPVATQGGPVWRIGGQSV